MDNTKTGVINVVELIEKLTTITIFTSVPFGLVIYALSGIIIPSTIVLLAGNIVVYLLIKAGQDLAAMHSIIWLYLGVFALSPLFKMGVFADVVVIPTIMFFIYVVFRDSMMTRFYFLVSCVSIVVTMYGLHMSLDTDTLELDAYADVFIAIVSMGTIGVIVYGFHTQMEHYKSDALLNTRVIEEKNQELENYIETNLQLENFAHIASHELKTPVRSMSNYAGLILNMAKDRLSEQEQAQLESIQTKTSSMYSLTNDLLALSKVTNAPMSWESFDLKRVLEDLIHYKYRKYADKISIGKNAIPIYGSAQLMYELFDKLLAAAIKRSKENIRIQIDVMLDDDSNVSLLIIDDNLNIPAEKRDMVLDIFGQVDADIELGLSLAYAAKVIEKHNGKVKIIDTPSGTSAIEISNIKSHK